jgi:hypothetical protein
MKRNRFSAIGPTQVDGAPMGPGRSEQPTLLSQNLTHRIVTGWTRSIGTYRAKGHPADTEHINTITELTILISYERFIHERAIRPLAGPGQPGGRTETFPMSKREQWLSITICRVLESCGKGAAVLAHIKRHSAAITVNRMLPTLPNDIELYKGILTATGYKTISLMIWRGVTILQLQD